MGLQTIKSDSTWGKASADINNNFDTLGSEITKVKNATTNNKGYFDTSEELIAMFPSGTSNQIAYVGKSHPYAIWKWDGTKWYDTKQTGGAESLDLNSYYPKKEVDEKFTETDAKLSELGSELRPGVLNKKEYFNAVLNTFNNDMYRHVISPVLTANTHYYFKLTLPYAVPYIRIRLFDETGEANDKTIEKKYYNVDSVEFDVIASYPIAYFQTYCGTDEISPVVGANLTIYSYDGYKAEVLDEELDDLSDRLESQGLGIGVPLLSSLRFGMVNGSEKSDVYLFQKGQERLVGKAITAVKILIKSGGELDIVKCIGLNNSNPTFEVLKTAEVVDGVNYISLDNYVILNDGEAIGINCKNSATFRRGENGLDGNIGYWYYKDAAWKSSSADIVMAIIGHDMSDFVTIENLESEVNRAKEKEHEIEEDIVELKESMLYSIDFLGRANRVRSKYIKNDTGLQHPAAAYWYIYIIKNVDSLGIHSIDANIGCNSSGTISAIAFYSENEDLEDDVEPTSFMRDYSVVTDKNETFYSAVVPVGCKMIVITNNINEVASPSIVAKFRKTDKAEKTEVKTNNLYNGSFLFGKSVCYGHYFIGGINDQGSTPVIPCQSLADINATSRLGCKYIEFNVKTTSDGVMIPLHGMSGKFGYEVVDLNGEFTYANTDINSVTYDWIKNNLRYRSKYKKYQTSIPTLEEALAEAKLNGMSVMMTFNDATYALAKKYYGDNFIAYNGSRDTGFTGIVMQYSSLDTKEEILAKCDEIGAPYIHMLNTTVFPMFLAEEGALKDLADAVHEKGCMLGIAASYENTTEIINFLKNGGDVLATDSFVNGFDSGNICNIVGEINFSDFQTNGSVIDGSLVLADGNTISSSERDSVFLGKGYLSVRFKGKLRIDYFGHPSHNSQTWESDGNTTEWVSTYYLEQSPHFSLKAIGEVVIDSIVFRASKV